MKLFPSKELAVQVPPRTASQLVKDADAMRTVALTDAESRIELDRLARLAKIETDRIEREATFQRENEERDRARVRAAEASKDKAKVVKAKTGRNRVIISKAIPYLPLFLVNIAAMSGQIGWALDHLEIGEPGTVLRWITSIIFGVTAESIALFLQYYANRALLNRDAAGSLYLAAFMVAGLVASVNYSHWSNPALGEFFGRPNATAVIFAMTSMISPWLWRIHNRAEYREALKKAGEIDVRAVKLSLSRKIMHPYRSFMVVWYASWSGITVPSKAIASFEEIKAAKALDRSLARAEKLAYAERLRREKIEADALAARIREQAKDKITVERIEEVPAVAPVAPALNGRRPMTAHAKWNDGLATYSASVDSGKPLTVAALAAALGQKNKVLASAIIRHHKEAKRS